MVALADFAGDASLGGGWVLHPNTLKPYRIESARCRFANISPDGRWSVFSSDREPSKVYETATGRCVFQLLSSSYTYASFSPDGRWLATDTDGGRVYAVGTWEPGVRLGPGFPWGISPDSRLVVMVQPDGNYRLVELATGRELARLEDPDQLAAPAFFASDGARLVVAADDGLRVWDLRRIRRELAKLDLDWDAPPYPEPAEDKSGPLEVQIVGADASVSSDPTESKPPSKN